MYIKRELEEKFNDFLNDKEIIGIIGPRQAGKTTLINHCLDKLDERSVKINRISFENQKIASVFEENIEAFIEQYVKGFDIVFIDEVQYVKNSGKNLKFIFDTNQKIKLIISGSSATELSLQSIKYLVGRIIIFELQSLSFEEFLSYKNEKLFNVYKKNLFSVEIINQINEYVKEYLLYGGYPRVVIEKNFGKKKEILKNIFNTYILKEVLEILQYKENRIIERLVKFLALQIGGIMSYDDLSSKVGVSIYDIKNALYILEKTFICSYASNFHTNKQTELIKSPKVFFYDLGLRNVILNSFEEELIDGDLYENFIATQLLRKDTKLKYWRTKSKAEVDFIIEKGKNLIGIEVKTYLKSNNVEKSMRSFIQKYLPKECFILSLNYKDKRKIGNTQIYFLSYIEFFNFISTILK